MDRPRTTLTMHLSGDHPLLAALAEAIGHAPRPHTAESLGDRLGRTLAAAWRSWRESTRPDAAAERIVRDAMLSACREALPCLHRLYDLLGPDAALGDDTLGVAIGHLEAVIGRAEREL